MSPTLEKKSPGRNGYCGRLGKLRAMMVGLWKQSNADLVLSCVIVFVLLAHLCKAAVDLPEECFHRPFLFAELLKGLPQAGWQIIGWVAIMGLAIWKRGDAVRGWVDWEHGLWIRFLMVLALIASAWPTITYSFNHQYDQWHAADRMLVLVLAVGVWWRPVLVIPYIIQVRLVAMQFTHPIGGFTWMVLDQSLNMMLMWGVFHLISLVSGSRRTSQFFYLACVVAGLHYWPSGYAKLRESWVLHNQVQFLVTNTYANGWLGWMSQESIATFVRIVGNLSPLMKIGAVALECASVLILWRRKFALILVLGWISLHAGVFVISGICFWQWSLLDAGLLIVIWRADVFRGKEVFTTGGCLLAIALIGTSYKWYNVGALTWFDARGTYTYRFHAVDGERREQLPPKFFSPYEVQMNLNGFAYLSEEPVMGVMWGASRWPVAKRLYQSADREAFLSAEKGLAEDRLDEERKEEFRRFLTRHVERWNARPKGRNGLDFVRPPNQIITGSNGVIPDGQISRLEVVQVLSFFDGDRYEELRERVVMTIEFPNQ